MRLFTILDKTKKSGNIQDVSVELQKAIEQGLVEIDFPYPDILIIEKDNNNFFLNRYTFDGKFGGDTSHQNLDDAKRQAEDEYGQRIREWQVVPEDVRNTLEYILNKINL